MSLLLNAVGTRVTDMMSNRIEPQAQPQTQLERIAAAATAIAPQTQLEAFSMQDMNSQYSNAEQMASKVSRALDETTNQIAGRIASLDTPSQPGEEVMLNPQPLPPRWVAEAIKRPGDEVMLNPQPLPPRWVAEAIKRPGDEVSLNPQPLPPRWTPDMFRRVADAVALNPQPLPPVERPASSFSRLLQAVALNPQPLPPVDNRVEASQLQKQASKHVG